MSTRIDEALDTAADRLEGFVVRSQREGGLKAKVAEAFEEDPDFLRKLKPSLIAARARGRAPAPASTNGARRVTSSTEVTNVPTHPKRPGGGPGPWLVLGAALALGILAARVLDWRSHAHPRG